MPDGKGRVVFIVRLKPGADQRFRDAYQQIRHEVARTVPGHIVDQLCQLRDGDESWLITSEWESLDHFYEWERSPGHRELAGPLRECIAGAQSLKYDVVEETRGGERIASAAGAAR